jgi:predicted transcriptional regulator
MNNPELNIENQKLIYEFISTHPGSHLRKISRALEMHLSTLRYHLDYLEKIGLIVSKKETNLKIYYLVGRLGQKDKNIAPLLQQKRFRDIILIIIMNPGLSHSELSHKLSLKPSTLSKYINILRDRKIIYHKTSGRNRYFYPVDEKRVMELLLVYKKSFWDAFVDNVLEIYFER